jgi:hypothetical protein
MEYLEWNNLIAKHFFNEENAGKEVLLYVNDEIIKDIGKGADVEDFIQSIKSGPSWAYHGRICQKALQTFVRWRDRNLDYPPYIGYLAFFVLAAITETDYASYSYYPGFWKRLNEPQTLGTPPSFGRMILLWDDLEKWSTEDKHEELGRFTTWIRGSWRKIGLPLSQTIISKDEQKHLPALFEAAGLDPSAPPSPQIMLKLMIYYGGRIFEKRTLRVLNTKTGDAIILKDKLLDMALDELEKWDGTVPKEGVEEEQKQNPCKVNCGLRICLKYDNLSKQANTSIRLKAQKAYPEDGLRFKCAKLPERIFYCEEEYHGWSRGFKNEELKTLDAAIFDWPDDALFEDQNNNWYALFKGSNVKLFILGKHEGIPGWIETNRLDRGTVFMIATCLEATDIVRSWGKTCETFTELEATGLPQGWALFEGRNASESCNGIDVLTISSTVRLLLKGGVRIREGNTYLYTAPPFIVIENAPGNTDVLLNGKILKKETEALIWTLPDDLQPNEILRIEANAEGIELKRILRLEEPNLQGSFDATPWRNLKGQIVSEEVNGTKIRGAIVKASEGSDASLPSLLCGQSKQMVFVGNMPGQIAEWPNELLPTDWKPIWAFEKINRKKWKVSCCTKGLEYIRMPDIKAVKNINAKKWKEYVWTKRKLIEKPEIPSIRKKWLEFCEAAQNV